MMGTSCILVTARVHHWFKGRDGFVSNFILSKIVAQQVIILLSENKLSFLCVAKKAMINFVSFSCVQIFRCSANSPLVRRQSHTYELI